MGLLLAFFQPMARSLRRIEAHKDFGQRLDVDRLARSTTSDALAALDPQHLKPLIQDLLAHCPGLNKADLDLAGITRQIIAADGTYFTTLADVIWALRHTKTDGQTQAQVRANVQLDVATWIPRVISLSGDDDQSEAEAFAADLLADVLYVVDRNFVDFGFIKAVLDKGSDLVQRIRANAPAMRSIGQLPLTAADVEAGVVSDELVRLTGRDAPGQTFRLVSVISTDRHGKAQTLRLLTNLTDSQTVAAHVIAAVYRLRWQIELFFKWFKCFARMDHLLSTSRNGITTQLYVTVIAVLMMYVQSGRRVSIYALTTLSAVASGMITLEQALDYLAKMERERELNRARQAKRRASKKLA